MSVLHHPVSGEDPMRDHARTRVGSHSNQWNPTISAVLFGLPILPDQKRLELRSPCDR
jgi:hypothetical protein